MVITDYDEVLAAKIKTCRSNFKSDGLDTWRSSDFDPCRSNDVDQSSNGVELQSGGDEGRWVERIMKGIEGS